MHFVWISLSYATFGLCVDSDGFVIVNPAAQRQHRIGIPPIASWTLGRQIEDVIAYYRRKERDAAHCPPRIEVML